MPKYVLHDYLEQTAVRKATRAVRVLHESLGEWMLVDPDRSPPDGCYWMRRSWEATDDPGDDREILAIRVADGVVFDDCVAGLEWKVYASATGPETSRQELWTIPTNIPPEDG